MPQCVANKSGCCGGRIGAQADRRSAPPPRILPPQDLLLRPTIPPREIVETNAERSRSVKSSDSRPRQGRTLDDTASPLQ